MSRFTVQEDLGHFSRTKRNIALIVILLASFMDLLDTTIVNVAIPSIQATIKATYGSIQWVTAGYALTFAIFLITGGRLGDIFGRKKVFLIGMFGFTLASALCGLSVNPNMLIGSRFFQGAMAAVMVPQVLTMIQVLYTDPKERGSVTGIFSAVAGLATVMGPILGALLIQGDYFGLKWRPIFLVNLLVGIIALIVAYFVLPETKSSRATKLDIIGVILITLGLLLLIYPIIQGRELGWPRWSFIVMASSLPVLVIFFFYERYISKKKGSPLIVLDLFKIRSFTAGFLVSGIFMTGVGSFFLTVTLFLQIGLGFTPLHAGLTTIPFSLGVAISAGISGSLLIPKLGKWVLTYGAIIMADAMGIMMLVIHHYGTSINSWELAPVFFLSGIGMGMIVAPMTLIAISEVHTQDAGSASGLLNTIQQIGGALGIALVGVVFFGLLTTNAPSTIQTIKPQLQNKLSQAGIPSFAQSSIVDSFSQCFHDRASEKDPEVVPSSCKTNNNNGNQVMAAEVGKILSSEGSNANSINFETSFESSLWYEIFIFALTCIVSLFLPNKKIEVSNTEII